MNYRRPLFIQRFIRAALLFGGKSSVLIGRVFFLIVSGFRKLKVDEVTVNNAFLLANGRIIIHWRVRNALWIWVDRRWMGSRGNQVLVLPAKDRQTVTIYIQGLFSGYKRIFDVNPQAVLNIEQPHVPDWTLIIKEDRLSPVFSPILRGSIGFTGDAFVAGIQPIDISIPPFPTIQTESQHETRLLHHP